MKYVFINRFFLPDQSATSIMLGDLLNGLDRDGMEILVLTSSGTHSAGMDPDQAPPDGVRVVRLPALPGRPTAITLRLLQFTLFYIQVLFAGLWYFRRGDVVVCLTDPPLAAIPVQMIARLKRSRLINWVQDIYPETATRLGFGNFAPRFIRFVTWLRDRAWRKSYANVCIGYRMRDFLAGRGVPEDRLHVIPNWTDEQVIVPTAPDDNPLRSDWGFEEHHLVVGYSGNLGRAHDADTMLDAGRRLVALEQTHLQFLFVGGGVKQALLPDPEEEPAIASNFQIRGYTPRKQINQSLAVADIHWLSLEPELEGLIVPSKVYGAMAAGRPIIFIGDPDGEVAQMIAAAKCGMSFHKGSVQGVADFIRDLSEASHIRRQMGENARRYSLDKLARMSRIEEWSQVLKDAAAR